MDYCDPLHSPYTNDIGKQVLWKFHIHNSRMELMILQLLPLKGLEVLSKGKEKRKGCKQESWVASTVNW